MTDQGAYIQLWKKYLPVIRLLLKKTETGEQKLQLYKHEFEKTGARNKAGYIFTLELVNGKPVNNSAKKAAPADLLTAMNENEAIMDWIRGQSITISVNKSCELSLQKTVPATVPA